MKRLLVTVLVLTGHARAEVPAVPGSLSPDGEMHAVLDVDRDPKISPEWKEGSFPQIEITRKDTGQVLASIGYFGSPGDDARPLREHVRVNWRPDSKAFGLTIKDRFYSSCVVYVRNEEGTFVPAPLLPTDYEELTGFPAPDVEQLRPRGRNSVVGWDEDGHLIYSIFLSPLPTYTGTDPLRHRVHLDVTPAKVTVVKVEHETGAWLNGEWTATGAGDEGGKRATGESKGDGDREDESESEDCSDQRGQSPPME